MLPEHELDAHVQYRIHDLQNSARRANYPTVGPAGRQEALLHVREPCQPTRRRPWNALLVEAVSRSAATSEPHDDVGDA